MRDHPAHRVYVRQFWANQWAVQPYLYADRLVWACSPETSSAELRFDYGDVLRPGTIAFEQYARRSLLGYYVKVEIDRAGLPEDPILWHGVITEDYRERGGVAGGVATGSQRFVALGLEYLLDRNRIDASIVSAGGGVEHAVGRAIGFNLGGGGGIGDRYAANKHTAWGNRVAPIFARSLGDALVWSAWEMIEYLLRYHSPTDTTGRIAVPWALDFTTAAKAGLGVFCPALPVEGLTIKRVLDRLIDRRRGLGWHVVVVGSQPQIRVFSFNADQITLPDGRFIGPNLNQVAWDFDSDPTVRQATLHVSSSHVFDAVVARGQRRGCCFTIDYTHTFDKDWTAAQETTYETAATASAGYAALTDAEKKAKNKAARGVDSVRRVFRYFRIVSDWNGDTDFGVPIDRDSQGNVAPVWPPGLRFQSHLPLLSDHDYSGGRIAAGTVTDTTPEGAAAEYRKPFAVINANGGAIAGDAFWAYLDRLPKADEYRKWSASLQMQPDALGFIVDVQGRQQHVLAYGDFDGAEDPVEHEPELDWRDIYVTVMLEADGHAEAIYPAGPAQTLTDQVKTLVIDVKDARLDYVAPNTIVDVDDAGALVVSNGGYVRDDRPRLRNLARIAYAWYSTPRQALTVQQHRLDTALAVGYLVTTIGAGATIETVNSVVTHIAFDLVAGIQTIKTQFAELDVRAL